MRYLKIKSYMLPNGLNVVSYYDKVRDRRILKEFDSFENAQTYLSSIRNKNFVTNAFGNSNTKIAQDFKAMNIDQLVSSYFEEHPNSSLSKHPKMLNIFLEEFSYFTASELTIEHLKNFFIKIKNEYDYADRSLLRFRAILSGFVRFLVQKNVIDKFDIHVLQFNRKQYKKPPVILSTDEIKNILEVAKLNSPSFYYPILLLIHETAAKREDILKLKWKDLDFKNNKIYYIRSHRIQKRILNISDKLIQTLKTIERKNELVFTSLNSKPLCPHVMGRELRRFKKQCGLKGDWSFKDLRASFAFHFLKQNDSIRELQKIMGHSDYHTTIESYGRFLNP